VSVRFSALKKSGSIEAEFRPGPGEEVSHHFPL